MIMIYWQCLMVGISEFKLSRIEQRAWSLAKLWEQLMEKINWYQEKLELSASIIWQILMENIIFGYYWSIICGWKLIIFYNHLNYDSQHQRRTHLHGQDHRTNWKVWRHARLHEASCSGQTWAHCWGKEPPLGCLQKYYRIQKNCLESPFIHRKEGRKQGIKKHWSFETIQKKNWSWTWQLL